MSDILLVMEQPFLKYSKDLDDLITPAIEHDLKVKVVSVEKIPTGEFNYSYKITTETDVLIARVFRERSSPQDGKLEWIEERLEKHNIPHAKTLYYTRENKYFPYGYMVQEFVDGMSGSTVILENHLSFEEFFNQYVTILQKIHSIKANELGKIPNWAGKVETFYESGMAKYNKIYDRLKSLDDIDQSTHEIVLDYIKVLKKYDDLYEPVLLHGDPGADNAILKKDGEMILIDWDNSVIGSWIEEYAGMSFRGTYLWRYKTDEERKEMLERSFKNNYKGVVFEDPKLKEIVQILHIITAYGALATHYFQHENMELYEIAKKRLAKHLNPVDQTLARFMDGEKVKIWPSKQNMRLLVLEYLSSKFEVDKIYSEKEVNEIIDQFQTFGDHATIRRDLFEHSLLNRDNYGTKYWKDKIN